MKFKSKQQIDTHIPLKLAVKVCRKNGTQKHLILRYPTQPASISMTKSYKYLRDAREKRLPEFHFKLERLFCLFFLCSYLKRFIFISLKAILATGSGCLFHSIHSGAFFLVCSVDLLLYRFATSTNTKLNAHNEIIWFRNFHLVKV